MTLTKRSRRVLQKVGLLLGLLAGAAFAGAPVLWMLSSSFKPNTLIFEFPPRFVTEGFSFDAYAAIFGDPEKIRFFINSYVVSGAVTIATLFVAILASYAFSRYDFPFKKPLNVIIVSVQAVPPITLLVPYFGLVVTLGLFNTYPGLILTYMVFTLPYAIIMMTGYFNTIPRELDEAVRMVAHPRAHLGARHRLGRGLHLHDRVERVPFRAHPHQDDRHAHGAHRHPAAHGSALV
jgi:multiple sugar transport system permease protein